MLTFKTVTDISKLSRDDPSRAVIQSILTDFPRDADIHGYIVLIEDGDTQIDLPELKGTIADMQWEGVWRADGHYHALYLTNNEFALEFVIPASIDGQLRDSLEAQMSPSYLKKHPF